MYLLCVASAKVVTSWYPPGRTGYHEAPHKWLKLDPDLSLFGTTLPFLQLDEIFIYNGVIFNMKPD